MRRLLKFFIELRVLELEPVEWGPIVKQQQDQINLLTERRCSIIQMHNMRSSLVSIKDDVSHAYGEITQPDLRQETYLQILRDVIHLILHGHRS